MTSSAQAIATTPRRLIGVGVACGGLEAVERLFRAIPSGTGATFIVQQHAVVGPESGLRERLARCTTLEVRAARDGALVEPNIVYVAPPRREVMVSQGRLLLSPRYADASLTLPIDRLFRSLARDAGPRAVGVLLSNGGSDGPRGARLIQEGGGVAICQSGEAPHREVLPEQLRATGVVPRVLAPEAIANAVCRLLRVSAEQEVEPAPLSSQTPAHLDAPRGQQTEAFRLLRAEAAVKRLEARLEREIELRERLSSRLSHELRNPLMALLNAAGMIAANGDDPALRARAIPILDRQARRLVHTLNTFLDGSDEPNASAEALQPGFTDPLCAPAPPTRRSGAAPTTTPSDPLRVLVVEDQDDNRDLLRIALEHGAYRVRTASDVHAAIDCLEDELPDIAIVDIGLPDGSGIEVAKAARALEDGKPLRLIALTGHGQPRDRERILEAGFDKHLVKPISMASLLETLAETTST